MALAKKTLWVVDIKTEAAEKMFAKHALAISATAVCIRTSSGRLEGAIDRFHKIGIMVYGWRWPSAVQATALAEANKVAKNLIPAGLDGYIVDPESDGPGKNDWNNSKKDLGPLAKQFFATQSRRRPARTSSLERPPAVPIQPRAASRTSRSRNSSLQATFCCRRHIGGGRISTRKRNWMWSITSTVECPPNL